MTYCVDLASTKAFLASLDGHAPGDALRELCSELGALAEGESVAAALARLEILEELRVPSWVRLATFERDHLARVLPFTAEETVRWRLYIEAWSLLLAAYLRLLADADQGDAAMAGLTPLLVQRVVRQAGQVAVASYRAYQGVAPDLWLLAHEHLRRAEKAGWADLQVIDTTLTLDGLGTVQEAWLHLVLLDFSDPYAMAAPQLALVNRWLERLVRHVPLSLEPLAHGTNGFLVARLDAPAGLRLMPAAPDPALPDAGSPRFVGLSALREHVRRLVAKLQLDISPEDLYLGESCSREDALVLLERLANRWRASSKRTLPRRPVNAPARMALGLTAIHRLLGQRALQSAWGEVPSAVGQPMPARALGSALAPDEEALVESQDVTSPLFSLLETQIVDQSPNGLGLLQTGEGAGRLRCHQLVALLTDRELLLGSVRWLSMDPGLGLRFGFKVITGVARPVRLLTSSTDEGSYERALLLPEMLALGEPASLITPPGVYFSNRLLRLWSDPASAQAQWIELEERLQMGSDFERVRFKPVA